MPRETLESLSKETLIRLAEVYSRNWKSLDGLWFGGVEAAFGLEAAVRLDLENWRVQAVTEATRLKEALGITGGGVAAVLKVLSFMSWQVTSPLFQCEIDTQSRAVIYYPRCAVHEARTTSGKPTFPCREMKQTLLSSIASVVDPAVTVTCIHCPPDPPGADCWCKWELRSA